MERIWNMMLKISLIIVLYLFVYVDELKAQTFTWEEFVERMTSGEEDKFAQWEYLYEDLAERHVHPFNLQTVTREQLETLPFLSPLQIENLLAYIYEHAPVETLSELQLVEGLDHETRVLLSFFVCTDGKKVGEKPLGWKNLLRLGKHEMVVRADIPFYYRKGYYQYSSELLTKYPNRRYLGDRFYHSFRYSYTCGDKLAVGAVGEKDAGEPFARNGNKGYDFYSYYLLLHGAGRLHTLALGNYRLNFGQGLVMNTQFALGKQCVMNTIYSANKGIKKHSSTGESDYFRGAAATVRWGRALLSGFYSFRELDATVDKGFITSLKTDGYHRTPLEISKKNNVNNHLTGINLSYSTPRFRLGLTTVYTVFNKPLKPIREYQLHNPHGRCFFASGVDYRIDFHRFSFIGETALSGNGGWATLNTFSFRFSPSLRFLLLQRFYAKNYEGIYARSFEEGGQVRNESGVYLGAEAVLGSGMKLMGYVDFFRFPYAKYRASFPDSRGVDTWVQLSKNEQDRVGWLLRYRYKSKGRDFVRTEDERKGIAPFVSHTAKAQLKWQILPYWMLKTTCDYVHTSFKTEDKKQGYQLGQSIGYASESKHFQCEAGGAYFHTDTYDTRVYSYERGLLYTFSFSSHYGKGVHAYLWTRYDINSMFTMLVKYVYTGYFDRAHIGSGTQEIEGKNKQDIYLQLRMRF